MSHSIVSVHWEVDQAAASDPAYRDKVHSSGGKLVSEISRMSEEELVTELKSRKIVIDRDKFQELGREQTSASDLLDIILEEHGMTLEEGWPRDAALLCLIFLWTRWNDDRPCLEVIDMRIHDGYRLFREDDHVQSRELWLQAVGQLFDLVEDQGIINLEIVKDMLESDIVLKDWLEDLFSLLVNDADEGSVNQLRLISNQFISVFNKNSDPLINVCRLNLAQSFFSASETARGDQCYEQWLRDEPYWLNGWSGWADNYLHKPHLDLGRAETILGRGLGRVNEDERLELMVRLARIYELQERHKDLLEINEKIRAAEEKKKNQLEKEMKELAAGNIDNNLMDIE